MTYEKEKSTSSDYIFATQRIGFRMWHESDIESFAQINADKIVMEYYPKPLIREETIAYTERVIKNISEKGYGLWAIEELQSKNFMGFIGFAHPRFESSFTPCVEIGWRLAKEFWNQGYATEGARACLKYGFEKFDFTEVYSFTAKINKRSESVMQKIGMEKCGEFNHPQIEENHPLCLHVLYRIIKDKSTTIKIIEAIVILLSPPLIIERLFFLFQEFFHPRQLCKNTFPLKDRPC